MTCINWQRADTRRFYMRSHNNMGKRIIGTAFFTFLLPLIVTNAKETFLLGVDFSLRSAGYIPAMDLALETINNDTTLPFSFDVIRSDSIVSGPARLFVLYCRHSYSYSYVCNLL